MRVSTALMAFAGLGWFSGLTSADDKFKLEKPTLPAPFFIDGKVDTVLEASGVEAIDDGKLVLIAHDKKPELHVVELATGRHVGQPITSPKFPKADKLGGPKWEGMARDADGHFYVIGAHVGKTDEERTAKSVLLRFKLKDVSGGTPTIDDASVIRWHIEKPLVEVLQKAGLDEKAVGKRKIEGLAVRERKGDNGAVRRELIIGLREPGDQVRAFAADISNTPADGAELSLKPLFSFKADQREGVPSQLTSLEDVPALGGLLVVTATEDDDNAFHGNGLWFVADAEGSKPRKLATFEVAMKAEGLAVLNSSVEGKKTSVRLLITFDNDPHTTKIPSRFRTITLVRESD